MYPKLAAGLLAALMLTGLVVSGVVLTGGSGAGLTGLGGSAEGNGLTDAPGWSGWLVPALLAMALATAISVATSFYLYRWRRILIAQPNLLVPEEWGGHLARVGQDVAGLGGKLERESARLSEQASASAAQVAQMVESFLTLQRALDEREAEIRRLKEGYDAQVFGRFLKRFVRVHQALVDVIDEAAEHSGRIDPGQIALVKRLLEDAFEDCGLEPFEPPLGADYRREAGVGDTPKTVKTDRPEAAFTIAEVLEPGYRLTGGEDNKIVLPAKVRIHLYEE